jgi:hypothetical protein
MASFLPSDDIFEEKYARVHHSVKQGGTKTLRCFPHCLRQHKSRGVCATSLQVHYEGHDPVSFCFGRFMMGVQAPNAPTINVGDEVHPEGLLHNSCSPHPIWWSGKLMDQKVAHGSVFELNSAKKSWHYGFAGSNTPASRNHKFVVYFFEELPSKMLKVVHVHESKQFAIFSSRRTDKVRQRPLKRARVSSTDAEWIKILRGIEGLPLNRGKPIREAILSAMEACRDEHIVAQLQDALSVYKGNAAGKAHSLALSVMESAQDTNDAARVVLQSDGDDSGKVKAEIEPAACLMPFMVDPSALEITEIAEATTHQVESGAEVDTEDNFDLFDFMDGTMHGTDYLPSFNQSMEEAGSQFSICDSCDLNQDSVNIDVFPPFTQQLGQPFDMSVSNLQAAAAVGGDRREDAGGGMREEARYDRQERQERQERPQDTLQSALLQMPPPREKVAANYSLWCPRMFTEEEGSEDEGGDSTDEESDGAGAERGAVNSYRALMDDEEGEVKSVVECIVEGDDEGGEGDEGDYDNESMIGEYISGAYGSYGCQSSPITARLTWFRIVVTAMTCACALVSLVMFHQRNIATPSAPPVPPGPPGPPAQIYKNSKCPYWNDSTRLHRNLDRAFKLENKTLDECRGICSAHADCNYFSWGTTSAKPADVRSCIGCNPASASRLETFDASGFLTMDITPVAPTPTPKHSSSCKRTPELAAGQFLGVQDCVAATDVWGNPKLNSSAAQEWVVDTSGQFAPISHSSSTSMCIGVTNGQLAMVACAQAPRWKYDSESHSIAYLDGVQLRCMDVTTRRGELPRTGDFVDFFACNSTRHLLSYTNKNIVIGTDSKCLGVCA